MSAVISVRVNDQEAKVLAKAAEIFNCKVSSLIKKCTFERLEDEYDMKVFADYEAEKKAGTLKTRPIGELWKELDL